MKLALPVIIIFMLLAAILIKSNLIFTSDTTTEETGNAEYVQPSEVPPASFSGEFVCLPDKLTNKPPVDECQFGLKLDDGSYVVLDFTPLNDPQVAPQLVKGSRLTLTGNFVPVEELTSVFTDRYSLKGLVLITEIKQ